MKFISVSDDEFNIIQHQNIIMKDFVCHYLSYKRFHSKRDELKGEKGFWVHTVNAHIMVCFNFWCMIFGSENNNNLHWKNLNFNIENIQNVFEEKLLKELSLTQNEWKNLRRSIITFRNKYIAHRDIGYKEPVPYLDNAYKAIIIYSNWLREDVLVYSDMLVSGVTLEQIASLHENMIDQTLIHIVGDNQLQS
ncbi:hypothetical protein BMG_6204 (plasmid) [Priestia megaterium]|uniref:hypothetical protein n=1 Tax=Priestia megaterium TaxID=1404 RepID=UPI0015DD0789|nr:hypothetical protein [Priestia megaterium]QLK09429.1 hypothetical protein BMG_6204 [Priestia megaterium]